MSMSEAAVRGYKGKRVVIYTRVSRDDSGEGKSNDRQESEALRLVEYKRWEVVRITGPHASPTGLSVQDISISAAGKVKRPGWELVLDMIKAGLVDYVVAYAMDRMTRNMGDLEKLIVLCEETGVGVATVDGDIDLTTEMGRMIARILGAVARAEIEIKGRRQRLANAERAAQGEAHRGGVRPFGYMDDRVTINPAEAKAIKKAAKDVLAGVPLTVIAAEWADAGLVSSRAEKAWEKGARPTYAGWTARGVRNVLTNPRNAGIRVYNGERVGAGKWKPILDLETLLRVNEYLTDPGRKRGKSRGGRTPQTLLTGILRCEVCKGTVRAATRNDRGTLYPTYACRLGCVHVDRNEADGWVLGKVITELQSPSWATRLAPSDAGDDLAEARRVVAEQEVLRKSYAAMLAARQMDQAQFVEASAVSRQLTEEAEAVLVRSAGIGVFEGLKPGTPKVAQQVEGLPLARQRSLVQKLVVCTLSPQNKNRRELWPVSQRITIEAV